MNSCDVKQEMGKNNVQKVNYERAFAISIFNQISVAWLNSIHQNCVLIKCPSSGSEKVAPQSQLEMLFLKNFLIL